MKLHDQSWTVGKIVFFNYATALKNIKRDTSKYTSKLNPVKHVWKEGLCHFIKQEEDMFVNHCVSVFILLLIKPALG